MRARGLGARRRTALLGACATACAAAFGVLASSAGAGPYPGAPDPGGDQGAIVSVPPPAGKFLGYHEETAEWTTHGWSAAQLAAVARGGGANLLRFSLDWFNVEPQQDHWDENQWRRYGRLYDALVAEGIKPLITLGGVPPWARPPEGWLCGKRRGCEYPPAAWMDGEWAEFAAEVARRFPLTAAIEIWNEPNLQGFWKPNPNPYRFAQLVAAAYPAIKAANPDVAVLAGGFAPTQTPETLLNLLPQLVKWPMKDFLARAYAAQPGIANRLDGISFHTTFNELDYGAESLFAKSFADVRTTAAANGDAGIDLWITETGLTTAGSQAVTEAQQASGLLAQYRREMTMPDVRAIVLHTLADRVELPLSDFNRNYGVIRSFSPFVPKPAFCAFAGRVQTPTPFGGCPAIAE